MKLTIMQETLIKEALLKGTTVDGLPKLTKPYLKALDVIKSIKEYTKPLISVITENGMYVTSVMIIAIPKDLTLSVKDINSLKNLGTVNSTKACIEIEGNSDHKLSLFYRVLTELGLNTHHQEINVMALEFKKLLLEGKRGIIEDYYYNNNISTDVNHPTYHNRQTATRCLFHNLFGVKVSPALNPYDVVHDLTADWGDERTITFIKDGDIYKINDKSINDSGWDANFEIRFNANHELPIITWGYGAGFDIRKYPADQYFYLLLFKLNKAFHDLPFEDAKPKATSRTEVLKMLANINTQSAVVLEDALGGGDITEETLKGLKELLNSLNNIVY